MLSLIYYTIAKQTSWVHRNA